MHSLQFGGRVDDGITDRAAGRPDLECGAAGKIDRGGYIGIGKLIIEGIVVPAVNAIA